jgi:hypothetical protein
MVMAFDDPDLPLKGVVPTPEELKDLLTLTVRQSRKDLEYSFMLPDGWYQQPLPPGRPDFSNESEFTPIGIFSAFKDFVPPVVFAVSVRPAPKQGTVAEWLEKQCYLHSYALQKLKLSPFMFGMGADGSALQASDFGPLKMRITMFEDGGRLFALMGQAPLDLWEDSVAALSLCTLTFELLEPKGQTAPLAPMPPPEERR